ncbi:MAG TPA: GNAT family protein [Solirubrobacteraceae bacterium]|jgi:aminoglycoside 6'-N-acetyltransferase|nr:GNAT family protein [Solirubrobacteraceae bacterium]
MSDSPIGRVVRVAGRHDLWLRPLVADDTPELLRVHATPGVVRFWGEPEDGFPFADEPEQTRLTIVLDGRAVGLIQFWEEAHPRYRHATIDLFLDPCVHGRGIGTEALRLLVEHLTRERGHHRLTIDPAADNPAAIRSYEKAGFRAVGVMRRYEHRGGEDYRDALLMELVVE